MRLAALGQLFRLAARLISGFFDAGFAIVLAFAQAGHILQDILDFTGAHQAAAQIPVHVQLSLPRPAPEFFELLQRLGSQPLGLGQRLALPRHGQFRLPLAKALDGHQFAQYVHVAASPTLSAMASIPSGKVECSSVFCRRNRLMASILSMASSVTASPPRLYSPIFTSSSTSWYLAISSRTRPASRLCS